MLDLFSPEPQQAELACCFFVLDQQLYALQQQGNWRLPRHRAVDLRHHPDCYFIGVLDGMPCYVARYDQVNWADWSEQALQPLSLRQLVSFWSEEQFAMASRALQYQSWRQNHRYCSRCGTPTQAHSKDLAMVCPRCNYHQYPRISPCIITLVHDGDYVLLGRSPRFPAGMYSCLAGFIEAGENAEQAVIREVAEEAAVSVAGLRYFHSQSWPFPHSLMLGFFAEYQHGEVACLDNELEDAGWYHYQQLPQIPPPGSIARSLIDHWCNYRQEGYTHGL